MAEIRIVQVSPDEASAQLCLAQYYAELNARFTGGFVVELSHDPDARDLVPPRGAFFVALAGDAPVGCVALKGGDAGYSEIKRMWIDPAARGSGLARKLMDAAEQEAIRQGVALLRLDTNRALPHAIATYRHWGWTEIARYNDDPYAEVFFEKPLAIS